MGSRHLVVCFVACLACASVVAAACQSKRSPSRPVADETKPAPAADPVPAKAPAVAPLPPAPNPPGEAAYAHRGAGQDAARAVLAADLPSAQPHLAWLAHHEYPQRLPVPWRPHATRLQLAARVLARSATAGEAARGLPALSAACGACHEAITDRDFDTAEHPRKHGDAALAILEALSGRSEELFATAAGLTPQLTGKPEAAALDGLRKAAARAEVAPTWIDRTKAAEELFSLCGTCHEALR